MAPTPSGQASPSSFKVFDFCSSVLPLRWATLPITFRPAEPKDVTAKLTTLIAPDEIYIVRAGAEILIDALNEELDYEVCELIATDFPDHVQFFGHTLYESGICVAAKNLDNRWARGLILDIRPGKETKLDVFFVDHGDTCYDLELKDVFPLPRKFLDQLEFQAIGIKLKHVEPIKPAGWTVKAEKFLNEMLLKNEISSRLEILAFSKLGTAETTNLPKCNWYNTMVFTISDKELGETLVDANMARFKDGVEFQYKKSALLTAIGARAEKVMTDHLEDDDDDSETSILRQLAAKLHGFEFFGE